MEDAREVDEAAAGRPLRRVALAVVLLACASVVAWTLWRDRAAATDCQPDGGLRCSDRAIALCDGGKLVAGVPCTGGCVDDGGVARCVTEAGALTAPVGAVCEAGMSVCSHDALSLLVCRDGRLAVGASCPHGCLDQGEGLGLFCLDDKDGIRFAEGFPCPGFSRGPEPERTCGHDSETLLVCKDGLLVFDATKRCHPCNQARNGALTCEGATTADAAPPAP